MKSVCVFCGSKIGKLAAYRESAAQLGRVLARRGLRLVYGGGSVGLMGVLADAVLAAGGQVTGVIPAVLATRELLHPGVPDMRVVESMHVRKATMAELADAFIALPGGYGTFEELFEMITWAQLGLHAKTIGVLNVEGYFDALVGLIDRAVSEGFIKPRHRELVVLDDDPGALLDRLTKVAVPRESKWITPAQA